MEIEILRHFLALISYRFHSAIADSPENFPYLKIGNNSRSPVEIIDHMAVQINIAIQLIAGTPISGVKSTPIVSENFAKSKQNFLSLLSSADIRLESLNGMEISKVKMITQGPLADCLTHIGQLAMLRRLSGSPVETQNFLKAKVLTGKLDYEE